MCDVSCVGNIYLLGGGVAGVAIVYIIGETIYIYGMRKRCQGGTRVLLCEWYNMQAAGCAGKICGLGKFR